MKSKSYKTKIKNKLILTCIIAYIISLTGCGSPNNSAGPSADVEVITSIPKPEITPADIPVATPDIPEPTDSLPQDTVTPFPTDNPAISAITADEAESIYNYINKMPLLYTPYGIYAFGSDGLITHHSALDADADASYTISSLINSDLLSDEAAFWSYTGSIYFNDLIYVSYDYLGNENYSVLISINSSDMSTSVCLIKPYHTNESYNDFTFLNDRIYYTDIAYEGNSQLHSLMSCDLSGSDIRTEFINAPDTPIYCLFAYENCVYYLAGNSGSSDICVYSTINSASEVLKTSVNADFLYVYDKFILLSYSDSGKLSYLNTETGTSGTVSLSTDNDDDINAGLPVLCNGRLFVPVYPDSENTDFDTIIAEILFSSDGTSVISSIDTGLASMFCIGAEEGIIIFENSDTYMVFDIDI